MICVESQRIIRGSIEERILRWAVWFQTPLGICETLHEAVELMKKNEMDHRMYVFPVSVAISSSTHEVWAR